MTIVGQLCLNNGTACFQNREMIGELENTHASYKCQQSYSRMTVWSGTGVQELNIPRGCVCQETTDISIVVSKPDECK